jgi:hypothetical protein
MSCITLGRHVQSLSLLVKGILSSFLIQLEGKSDTNEVLLTLWENEENPLFCPIIHLFAYLKLSKIRSGFLFPNSRKLQQLQVNTNTSFDDEDDNHISYDTYHTTFKSICKDLVNRVGPFGTHTGRKTAYLLAVWGGGSDIDIMASARHSTQSSGALYKKDSSFFLNLFKRNNEADWSNEKWIPIYCSDLQMGRAINSSASRFEYVPLLADRFIESQCMIDTNDVKHSVLSVIAAVMAYKRPTTSLEDLTRLLSSNLPDEIVKLALEYLNHHTLSINSNHHKVNI